MPLLISQGHIPIISNVPLLFWYWIKFSWFPKTTRQTDSDAWLLCSKLGEVPSRGFIKGTHAHGPRLSAACRGVWRYTDHPHHYCPLVVAMHTAQLNWASVSFVMFENSLKSILCLWPLKSCQHLHIRSPHYCFFFFSPCIDETVIFHPVSN